MNKQSTANNKTWHRNLTLVCTTTFGESVLFRRVSVLMNSLCSNLSKEVCMGQPPLYFVWILSMISICLAGTSAAGGQGAITNTLTKAHLLVRGTKVSIIPPKDFTNAPNFLGFEHNPSGSTVMVLDIPGPFSETSKGLTKEKLLTNGVDATTIEKLTFNGMQAMLITGYQKSAGVEYLKYVLTFGTDKETYMINAVAPKNNAALGNEVKKSILTAVYDTKITVNPFESIDYTLTPAKGGLKFSKRVASSIILSTDGNFPPKTEDRTSLIVAKSYNKVTIQDKKTFCINRLKQAPLILEHTESPTPISIDGIQGFEIIADAKEKSTERTKRIYQVVLFSDNLYYMFFGSTADKSAKSMTALKQVVQSFKRKPVK